MSATKSEPSSTTVVKPNAKPYGKIVLTLKNQLLPDEKLAVTPSDVDGLDSETETDLRIYGCELIQTAGILLKLPQVAMATGQVLLQRFYYSKSLVRHPVEHTAMACVCLASKIEEAPRRVRDVINVFTHIRQVNCNKPIQPVILDQPYIHLKNQVIKAERRVLKELGFSVHIKHPHKIIVLYLQVLGFESNKNLMQFSWNYMNDSLRTDVFVRYQPETVACACIYLTARKLRLPLPRSPAWYTIFGVNETDIRDVCFRILRLYNRPKVNVDALEKRVEELCKKYQEAKMKARGSSGNNTPSNNSPSSPGNAKTTGAHNAWGGFISRSGSHVAPPLNHNDKHHSHSKSPSHSPNNNNTTSSSQPAKQQPPQPSGNSNNNTTTVGGGGGGGKRSSSKKYGGGRSRSRSPVTGGGGGVTSVTSTAGGSYYKKGHKRRTYSRSRSASPVGHGKVARKSRDKRRSSRSPSNDRENKSDRYIDRYNHHHHSTSTSHRHYDTSRHNNSTKENSDKYDDGGKERNSSKGGYEKTRSYDEKTRSSYDEKTRSYDEKTKSYDEKTKSYDEKIKSYDEKIKSYDEKTKSYDEKTRGYDEKTTTSVSVVKEDKYDKYDKYEKYGSTRDSRGEEKYKRSRDNSREESRGKERVKDKRR